MTLAPDRALTLPLDAPRAGVRPALTAVPTAPPASSPGAPPASSPRAPARAASPGASAPAAVPAAATAPPTAARPAGGRPAPTHRPHPGAPRTGRAEPLPAARPSDLPRLSTSAHDLLALARAGLAEAASAPAPPDRYAAAHLSALRAAAAVIAARARPADPTARRPRPLSAWVLLGTVAPELGEWAAFFAAGARKRAAAEAHLPGAVTAREADDLLRDAETFLAVVETKLGAQPSLLARGTG